MNHLVLPQEVLAQISLFYASFLIGSRRIVSSIPFFLFLAIFDVCWQIYFVAGIFFTFIPVNSNFIDNYESLRMSIFKKTIVFSFILMIHAAIYVFFRNITILAILAISARSKTSHRFINELPFLSIFLMCFPFLASKEAFLLEVIIVSLFGCLLVDLLFFSKNDFNTRFMNRLNNMH